jgi:hypothetical protein
MYFPDHAPVIFPSDAVASALGRLIWVESAPCLKVKLNTEPRFHFIIS